MSLSDSFSVLRPRIDEATASSLAGLLARAGAGIRSEEFSEAVLASVVGGKRFRALMAHVGYCLGAHIPLEEVDIPDLGAALELYQASALVHDDIIDNANERRGMPTRVQTAIEMRQIAEPFIRGRAVRHLEKGRVVIFAAGTGNPHFTTDSAAALRAAEVDADAILKCTTVDTLFDSDPRTNPDAKPIIDISYGEVIKRQLHVMDITAFTLCHEREIPQGRIFSLADPQNLVRVVNGEPIGTTIHM